MILDFNQLQLEKFDQLAQKILQLPNIYLQFESVADFYQSAWLDEFPKGTTWTCTGLDDGAEQFYAVIIFKNRRLCIDLHENITVNLKIIE